MQARELLARHAEVQRVATPADRRRGQQVRAPAAPSAAASAAGGAFSTSARPTRSLSRRRPRGRVAVDLARVEADRRACGTRRTATRCAAAADRAAGRRRSTLTPPRSRPPSRRARASGAGARSPRFESARTRRLQERASAGGAPASASGQPRSGGASRRASPAPRAPAASPSARAALSSSALRSASAAVSSARTQARARSGSTRPQLDHSAAVWLPRPRSTRRRP